VLLLLLLAAKAKKVCLREPEVLWVLQSATESTAERALRGL